MGAFGFTLPLTPLASEAADLDHDDYEELCAAARDLLEAWIEPRLKTEVEEEFLDLADDVWWDGCGFPGCGEYAGEGLHIPFFFTDHAPNVSAAVEHWFCLAAAALSDDLVELLGEHGFTVSLEQVGAAAEGVVLVPTEDDMVVVDMEGEEAEAYATSEEAPLFEELSAAIQQQAREARERGQCRCSICRSRQA
jgi:hypothetical protein